MGPRPKDPVEAMDLAKLMNRKPPKPKVRKTAVKQAAQPKSKGSGGKKPSGNPKSAALKKPAAAEPPVEPVAQPPPLNGGGDQEIENLSLYLCHFIQLCLIGHETLLYLSIHVLI